MSAEQDSWLEGLGVKYFAKSPDQTDADSVALPVQNTDQGVKPEPAAAPWKAAGLKSSPQDPSQPIASDDTSADGTRTVTFADGTKIVVSPDGTETRYRKNGDNDGSFKPSGAVDSPSTPDAPVPEPPPAPWKAAGLKSSPQDPSQPIASDDTSADGTRTVTFADGTKIVVSPDGTETRYRTNGDNDGSFKPSGAVDSPPTPDAPVPEPPPAPWKAAGLKSSPQDPSQPIASDDTSADGTRTVTFADGTKIVVSPDGTETRYRKNGDNDGSFKPSGAVDSPPTPDAPVPEPPPAPWKAAGLKSSPQDPSQPIASDDTSPDGTRTVTFADGTKIVVSPDGTETRYRKNGDNDGSFKPSGAVDSPSTPDAPEPEPTPEPEPAPVPEPTPEPEPEPEPEP